MFFIEQFMQWLYNYPILIAMFSFTIGLICMPVVIKIAKVRHFVVKPNKRMSHKGEVPNIGGIDIFMSFILAYLLFEYDQLQNSQYIFIGVFLILMTGFIDDLLVITPSWKMFGELLAGAFLIVISGIRLTNLHGFCNIYSIPLVASILLSFFVFIVIVNSLNLIDGVDGLASGLGIIYSLFFAIYFQQTGEIHLSIFRTVDVVVGIGQAGQRLAEITLRVPELFRERRRLVFQFPSGNPAGSGKGGLNGSAGFGVQFRMQGQRHAFFQSQGIADDGGGKFDHPLVPQVHQSIHDAGNQSLRLVGKDRVRPIRRGHKRHKELRKGFGAAERKRIVRVGKAARGFSFNFAGSPVVQHTEIIVPA